MKRVIITFLCLLCIVQAYSQSFTISGTIIDGESNEPLIGAGILVKGAGRGTITNIDGKYSLEVKRGESFLKAPICSARLYCHQTSVESIKRPYRFGQSDLQYVAVCK